MFPWLKGEPEVQTGFGAKNKPQPETNRLRSIEIATNKQSQSDQDLGRGQRVLETDRSLNNPYYYDNNRQTSRSGRQRLDSVKGRGINSNRPYGDNIAFDDDYQHKALDKNKQQYQDFYKNNVSEFQKRMNGQLAPSYEDKKKRLQYEQNEGENGIMTRLQYKTNRVSVSPSDYANVLKKQIEEKKEIQRQQKLEEDNYSRQEVISRNQYADNRGQQGERNLGQEENGGGRKVSSLHQQQAQKRSSLNNEYDPYSNDIRGRRSPFQQGGTGGLSVGESRGTKSSLGPNQKREEDFRQGRNFLGDIQDRDAKEQEQRKARQQEFYKGLENERKDKINNNKVGNREVSWGMEKSMVEQLGEKLAREEEKKAVLKADLAEELMQQIKEKKRLQREEKERQEMLDRKYDERVKAEAEQMKQKYEAELQGKQHEIKSVKKAHEKKKQEQKDKLNESLLSKNNPKSPDLTKIDASQIMPPDKTLEDQEDSNYPLPPLNEGQVDNVLRDLHSRGGNELDLRGFSLELNHQQIPSQQQQQQQQKQQQQQQLQSQQQQQQQNPQKAQQNLPQSPNLQVHRKSPEQQPYGQSPTLSTPQTTQNYQQQQQHISQQQTQMQFQQQQDNSQYQFSPQQPKLLTKSQFQQQLIFSPSIQLNNTRQSEGQYQREQMYQKQNELFAGREVNQHWNPPKFWEYKDRKNEEELNQLRAQLDAQTSLLSSEAIKIRQDLRAAAEKKTQALVDLENLKDQLRRQNLNESAKLQQLRNNMNVLSNTNNIDYLQPISNNQSKLAGAANMSLLNFSNFSTTNNNNNSSIHNQSSFMGGNGILSSNRQYPSRQQPSDMLEKYISNNSNLYGQKLNNSKGGSYSQPLDYKLEKRLNGVMLDKADMQLLEVDNLLNNLRYPI